MFLPKHTFKQTQFWMAMCDTSPEAVPPGNLDTAIAVAALALEMCANAVGSRGFSDVLAKAAIIAYLNQTGREAEAVAVSNVPP